MPFLIVNNNVPLESRNKEKETTMMTDDSSPEKKWQQKEKERLEYEGYCRKIVQGLESQDEKSGIRAIWELVQNAKDQSKAAKIKMELTDKSFIFSHHGIPFDYTSFSSLVKQDSSKDRADADLVGQYGTGFMTTHILNRMVYVSAPYAAKTEEGISGYVQIEDFPLDRTKVDTTDGPSLMKEQLNRVDELCDKQKSKTIENDTTSFRYDLKEDQLVEVSGYLECATRLMPFVMVLNKSITEIEVKDCEHDKWFSFRKTGKELSTTINKPDWSVVEETVIITDHQTGKIETCHCKSLKSESGDVVILPPYPEICGGVDDIPSLFLWFPLLGTEKFGVNFIFHSKRFYPVEKRNNIMLPGASQISKEKGGENERILKEMMEAVFEYYRNAEHARELSIEMCQVAFPEMWDNEETKRFYNEMQDLWSQEILKWKVLPVGDEWVSVDDNRVRLLHPDFYKELRPEQCEQYEPVITQYASMVKGANDVPILMPETNLIAWSKMVDRWRCKDNTGFYVTVAHVCEAIKSNGENLHTYLEFLRDSGNKELMEKYPLLPNRNGDPCVRNSLYHGAFMTDEVYQLVKGILGNAVGKIFDPSYLDILPVNPYSIDDLRKDIVTNIGNWRKDTLENCPKSNLKEDQLDALLGFCSASYLEDFTNQRGRMMRVLSEFYHKEFSVRSTIRFLESNEEDFYKPAFNFLLDYTLWLICQKDVQWVMSNKDWLLRFLQEYAPKENEDRKSRLDVYGVLPNMNCGLCMKNDLKVSQHVPDEMVAIYKDIFGKDLKEEWVDPEFDAIVDLSPVLPNDVAGEIEKAIVEDMNQDGAHRYEKIVRQIILKIRESKEWEDCFGRINEKKEVYTFSMKTGAAQKHLFSLMDNLDDNDLERLAKLGEDGNIKDLIGKMELQRKLEYESAARFNHLHKIGKHIEDILRERIGADAIKAEMPKDKDDIIEATDIQNGQDIVIKLKVDNDWKDIYYIEVKSKWNFSEPAHMSTRQVKMACLHPSEYALCCVDLSPFENTDLANLPEQVIIDATKVKMDIGFTLRPLMSSILDAEKQSDDIQIQISEYRSNIPAKVFKQGEPFDVLLEKIEDAAREKMSNGTHLLNGRRKYSDG